ncbi:MAG: hypothetical protein K9H49_08920 [Bacteroidales bacterium]|nr:hypothetical protein [Bacteroidales bacterium]
MKIISKSLTFILAIFLMVSCDKENLLPTCEITSPENGTEYELGNVITISVKAADEDGSISVVRFYINDILYSSASSTPFNYQWNTSDEEEGVQKIKVIVKDDKAAEVKDEILIYIIVGSLESGTVKDYDGNIYRTVVIGNQEWMAENLKVTNYKDGTSITNITDPIAWFQLTTPAYCWYNNDPASNKDTYGALYNWYTVNTGKLAPAGWHVPTDEEWTELTDYLGGVDIAGAKLKEAGTSHWLSPNAGVTNASGFTALPGGYRGYNGEFKDIGSEGIWWSSSVYLYSPGNLMPLYRAMASYQNYVDRFVLDKVAGFSVRCVRD